MKQAKQITKMQQKHGSVEDITLNGEFCSSTNESWRLFSGTNLTLEQSIVLNSYLRDHQVVFSYTQTVECMLSSLSITHKQFIRRKTWRDEDREYT